MGRRARGLSAAIAAVGCTLVACGAQARTEAVPWRVDEDPFRITVVRGGKTVVEQDVRARLRYQLASTGDQHRLTKVLSKRGSTYTVATDERGRTATVKLTKTATGLRIQTALHPAKDVQQIFDAFRSSRGEHFLGGGEGGDHVDMRGQIVQVKVSYNCSYGPAAFFLSTRGYGVSLGGDNVAALGFAGSRGGSGCVFGTTPPCAFPALPTRTEVCMKGAALDERIYIGEPREVQRAYTAVAGRQKVPPPSQLALVKWRDAVSGASEILDDIRRLRAARIPVGWVLLDNPWEHCVGELVWDRERIPDPKGLIDAVHARGVRFMLWISPDVFCPPSGYPADALFHNEVAAEIDLSRPAVAAEYERRLRRVFALGVDGVKGDRGDEADLEPKSPPLHNRYPRLFARSVLRALRATRGDGFSTMFRAVSAGEQRMIPGMWAGDQPGDWVGLGRAIRAGQTAGVAGFSSWGSDVGGYASAGLTPEVFARWAQVGAVSPIMEVGGVGPNATPWVLGAPAMDALRKAATLHYELFPYLYGLIRRREPVIRPLGLEFPRDEAAWAADLQFLVGRDLLAAPVTGPGTTPRIYLPRGRWVDVHTGRETRGGRAFNRPTPLDELPLYVRRGAVIPFNLRTRDSWWGMNDLERRGRAGWLATNGAEIALRRQPRNVQIFVPAAQKPRRVTLGGRALPFEFEDSRLRGVVVRVHGPDVRGRIVLSRT